MHISDFEIGSKVLIIAELSANHGQDINIAKKTILAAKNAGADAVKLQTYTPDTLTIDASNEHFTIKGGTIWDGRTLYDLYSEAFTPWEWHQELKNYATELGLIFFSTPFDRTAVDFLEQLDIPVYKVASFEITDIPLIEYIAATGKPIIISTGIASLSDIEAAVNACREQNNDQIILLKCTSDYPARIEDANLLTIPNLGDTFGVEVGLSDHTLGNTVPIVSVALGAKVIEKHLILDKELGGPDAAFSLEPHEFRSMVCSVREAEASLGSVDYTLTKGKQKNRLLSRSLFVVEEIKAGESLTESNIKSIRPGHGLPPKYLKNVLGKKVRSDLKKGTPLSFELLE